MIVSPVAEVANRSFVPPATVGDHVKVVPPLTHASVGKLVRSYVVLPTVRTVLVPALARMSVWVKVTLYWVA